MQACSKRNGKTKEKNLKKSMLPSLPATKENTATNQTAKQIEMDSKVRQKTGLGNMLAMKARANQKDMPLHWRAERS